MSYRAGASGPHWFDAWTRDLARDVTAEDLQRLFTRDTRDAYRFFTRHVDPESLKGLPWHKRSIAYARAVFLAFTMKLSPARRIVFGASLGLALIGLLNLFTGIGFIRVIDVPFFGPVIPGPMFHRGTWSLLLAFVLMNLLVLLEVADRLSLKNDLEVARDIQQAMLPSGELSLPGVETVGFSRPANTVGGDFYDLLPLDDGRVVVTVGDVAGKGSPAALLMALLLAILRTLVDERLEPAELVTRLNVQVSRHTPGSRFITLFYGVYDPASGMLTYVNAGHTQPLLLKTSGATQRLTDGGIALGMFEHSTYTTGCTTIQPGELLAIYSDGITEAENAREQPFDDAGLERTLRANRSAEIGSIATAVVQAVEAHSADTRLADDLTILLLRRRLQ